MMDKWFSEYRSTIIKTILVVIIIIAGICLMYGLLNGSIAAFFDDFLDIISPIIIGFVIAYLSNPIMMFLEKYLFKWIKKFTIRRLISIIVTLLLIILFLSFILTMLIPSIISTLQSFWDSYIVEYESSIISLANRINSIMDEFSFFDTTQRLDPSALVEWVKEKMPWIEDVVAGDFSPIFPDPSAKDSEDFDVSNIFASDGIMSLLQYVLSFGTSLINIVKNTVLGIFIAIYMLLSKEKCKAYFRRFLNSFLPPRNVRAIIRFGKLLDRSFGGFIEGQILDAIVVGVVSYVIFNIFAIPIPHLLATIIAVTNVIPIFGPFIGGIPAAFLVLLTAPEKTILFILLILVIQQIDGNVICPHILGDKINISSLATIIAIVTMGGLFGIFGMLIGVPVFAVVINMINNYTMNALRRKGLETSLKHYYVGDLDNISDNTNKGKKIDMKSLSNLVGNVKKLFSNKNNKNKKEK